jgi:hypothetical protein
MPFIGNKPTAVPLTSDDISRWYNSVSAKIYQMAQKTAQWR